MPRKVIPRWGETGVMKVPSFTLDDEQLAEIDAYLGLSTLDSLSQLKATLEWIGGRYRLWIQQDERGPSRAEQNAALKKLLASPRELESLLAQLDYATQAELLDMLWTHPLAKSRGGIVQLDQCARDTPELVIDCIKCVLSEGDKRRGPAGRKTLPIIIGWLASIYEETTGFKFTHTPYYRCAYTSAPQSHAGHFVTTFLRMVDPDLPKIPTAIATEMARFVKAREGNSHSSPGAVQTI